MPCLPGVSGAEMITTYTNERSKASQVSTSRVGVCRCMYARADVASPRPPCGNRIASGAPASIAAEMLSFRAAVPEKCAVSQSDCASAHLILLPACSCRAMSTPGSASDPTRPVPFPLRVILAPGAVQRARPFEIRYPIPGQLIEPQVAYR